MHLWPTKNLRDSFKFSYLKKLEWNYRRMERDQQQQQQQQSSAQQQQKLLDDQVDGADTPDNLKSEAVSVASVCQELLLVLSCCYCCFCCGACVEEK